MNLYGFVKDNPIAFVDPSGEQPTLSSDVGSGGRKGWYTAQQKFLRMVARMEPEEARKQGIPSHIHGWLRNELRRVSQARRQGKRLSIRVPRGYDIGHRSAHVLGGPDDPGNLRFELSSDNRARGPRE